MFALAIGQRPGAQTPPASGGPVDPAIAEDLVAANRILAQEGIVDAYGHVSIRHPGNPNRYLMYALGSPLAAVAHLTSVLAAQGAPAIRAGELVTTGTLTQAPLIRMGETWSTALEGIALPGLAVTFEV